MEFWNREDWVIDGLCTTRAHPDYWFPDGENGPRKNSFAARAAIEICRDCPVQVDCLRYANREGIRYGIWGGLTTYERTRKKVA